MMLSLIMLFVVSITDAVEVNFTGDWKTGVGWELVCSWSFPRGDRLQSVRLSRGGAQFKIYRPEIYGPRLSDKFHTPDSLMHLDCAETERQKGACVLTIEILQPPTNSTLYTCEVSGERPMFIMVKKDYLLDAHVPSNDVVIEPSMTIDQENVMERVHLNCTSTGLPAPELSWTIGHQKVQPDFTSKEWNQQTKLFHVWSSLAITPKSGEQLPVLCVPEQRLPQGLVFGPPAEYMITERSNGADRFYARIAVVILAMLTLQR